MVRRKENMKLKNVLIVVKDIGRSRQFYQDLFGLELVLDHDGNMILTEGFQGSISERWPIKAAVFKVFVDLIT